MEVGSASGASVTPPDHVAGHQGQGMAATVAAETKVGHVDQPSERSTVVDRAEGMPNRGRTDRNEGHLVSAGEISPANQDSPARKTRWNPVQSRIPFTC